jgi:signal transduction histidine kinase
LNQIWQFIKNSPDLLWRWFEKIVALLGGRTISMLAMAMVVTMLSVIYSDSWIQTLDRQSAMIWNIRTNIMTLHDLKTNLYKAESAQRGYLYTRREAYVEPFNKAMNDAREDIDKIETLIIHTSSGKEQVEGRDWLKAISASLEAKAAEMKVTLNLMKTGKPREAKQVTDLDEGLVEMKRFMDYTDFVIKKQNEKLAEKELQRQNTIAIARLSIVIGAIILIFLVVLVIRQLLKEIKIKSELQQRVLQENALYEIKLGEQTKLLRSLAFDYQADVERERQKLARELHDELGSIFTATKMDISWVIKKIKDIDLDIATEITTKLRKTSTYLDQGIEYKRNIVQELHPSILTTFGFWPALQSLINDAADRNQWQLTLNLPDENTKLNETLSLVIYRIVQETLNNANKYAKATQISVDMIIDSQHIKLEIEDNGVGMDMKTLNGNTHGLSGMKHRVLAIGGHIEIVSEPGAGVLTRVILPMDFDLPEA